MSFPFPKKDQPMTRSCTHVFLFFSRDGEPFFQVVMAPFRFDSLKALQGFGGSVKGHSTGITASKMPEIYTWLLSLPKLQVLSQAWGAEG